MSCTPFDPGAPAPVRLVLPRTDRLLWVPPPDHFAHLVSQQVTQFRGVIGDAQRVYGYFEKEFNRHREMFQRLIQPLEQSVQVLQQTIRAAQLRFRPFGILVRRESDRLDEALRGVASRLQVEARLWLPILERLDAFYSDAEVSEASGFMRGDPETLGRWEALVGEAVRLSRCSQDDQPDAAQETFLRLIHAMKSYADYRWLCLTGRMQPSPLSPPSPQELNVLVFNWAQTAARRVTRQRLGLSLGQDCADPPGQRPDVLAVGADLAAAIQPLWSGLRDRDLLEGYFLELKSLDDIEVPGVRDRGAKSRRKDQAVERIKRLLKRHSHLGHSDEELEAAARCMAARCSSFKELLRLMGGDRPA